MRLVPVDAKAKRDQTLWVLERDGKPVPYTGTTTPAELTLTEWQQRMFTGDYKVPAPAKVKEVKHGDS